MVSSEPSVCSLMVSKSSPMETSPKKSFSLRDFQVLMTSASFLIHSKHVIGRFKTENICHNSLSSWGIREIPKLKRGVVEDIGLLGYVPFDWG